MSNATPQGQGTQNGRHPTGPRCAAIVGPYLSGKTTLMESLLLATGAIQRRGTAKDGSTVGDASPESRARKMSVQVTPASTTYLGESWTFLDCPGSIEFGQETMNALMVADAAIVVVEPVVDRAMTVAPLLHFLDAHSIPHLIFVNKMDTTDVRARDVMEALQSISERPLVLRQVPIRKGQVIDGYVDVVSERAYRYKPGQASDLIPLPADMQPREKEVRQGLLEKLADYDDKLLEQLLEDVVPPKEEIYRQLAADLAHDLIVPVFLGAAERDHGVRRLLKALRHEVPEIAETNARLGVRPGDGPMLRVFKTLHQPHAGKLSFARVLRGKVKDNATLGADRIGGIYRMLGETQTKLPEAAAGEVVALGRMEHARTGRALTPDGDAGEAGGKFAPVLTPVYSLAITAEKRADEVKLSGSLAKLVEEDPSLHVEMQPDTHEHLLMGQGDIHLQVAVERLKSKYNLPVATARPQVPYKETIKSGIKQHTRYKRQTGGHGQFADIHVEIKPQPRGGGFAFTESIVGGSVPRNFIPSVEIGVADYLKRGPLGFPVVDVTVDLQDGQYHDVDSSDMAFRTCAGMAMREAMPKCNPVLLEPVFHVEIVVPNAHTARVQRLITGRRGQVLGFDAKEGWSGWDVVAALMPQAELHDLIVELRSLTLGVGTFTCRFDHLQELTGRLADQVVQARNAVAAAQ
ncbi:MAG: elongation factor G [Rhodospirillales bacterium]|nr:elongation factor G [Rhodospirillales bacterium]